MSKNQWDVYERIYSSHWFLTSYNAQGFVFDFPEMGGGSFMTHATYIMEKGMCRYIFDSHEFEQAADYTSGRLINDDRWRRAIYRNIDSYTKRYFKAGEKLRKLHLDTLSDKEIVKLIEEIISLQHYHQVYSVLVNGVVLDGRNHFSNKIREELRVIMGNPTNFDERWSLFSQSPKMSLRQKKEYEMAQLAAKTKKSSQVIERKLRTLHKKYCWLDYNNMGPAASLEKFWHELEEARKNNKNISLEKDLQDLKRKQTELIRQSKINKRGKFLIGLAQGVIWQKGYRKDVQYHGFYCYENLFRELARRNNTSDWKIFSYLFPWEVESYILTGNPPLQELGVRREYSCFIVQRQGNEMKVGNAAKEFVKGLELQEDFSTLKEIKGQCAYAGKVQGTVKIVQTPADMQKMNEGDILISQATSPDLLSAMMKAGAIVTNTGGLICHAAITSRELKVPCIVGTAKATLIFKDGDTVEVDATNGLIRKL